MNIRLAVACDRYNAYMITGIDYNDSNAIIHDDTHGDVTVRLDKHDCMRMDGFNINGKPLNWMHRAIICREIIDYANKHDMDVALIDFSGIIRYASIENMLTHVKRRLMIDKQDRMHEQLRMGAGYSMDGASIINQLIDRLRSHDDISMELMALGYDRMPSFIEQYLKIVNHS